MTTATVATSYFIRTRGKRRYELSNHLGNVQVVVSDRKVPIPEATNTTISYFTADIVSATDYYAFGMVMPDRSFNAAGYRFGFNGKETDNEVKGTGNQQDYGMRIYDPRIGRFLSTDPLTEVYPELTPYQFASNTPIESIDLDGLERYSVNGSISTDGSGNTIENATTTEKKTPDGVELAREGVEMTVYNSDTKKTTTTFIEPVVVTASRTKSFEKASKESITNIAEKTRILSAGRAIKQVGDAIEQAGSGASVELRGAALYSKLSYESYSTTASNVGNRTKLETGIRYDGNIQLGASGLEHKLPSGQELTDILKASIETRAYFFIAFKKPSLEPNFKESQLTWSLSNTTKIPIWKLGGVYISHDLSSEKWEVGFYGNTSVQKFEIGRSQTLKGGIKNEYNTPPK
jgi:RHS repeat-associated protein